MTDPPNNLIVNIITIAIALLIVVISDCCSYQCCMLSLNVIKLVILTATVTIAPGKPSILL